MPISDAKSLGICIVLTHLSKPQMRYLNYQNILEASTVPESDANL
jgi:hypothetical protein